MRRLTWMTIMLLAVLVVTSGCATLTEEEQFDAEYKRSIALEARDYCRTTIERNNGTWFVVYFGGRSKAHETHVDVMRDLWDNNCIDWLEAQGYDL